MRTHHSLLVAIAVGSLTVLVPSLRAATVKAQLFPVTGEVRLSNLNSAPFDFIFYSITSNGGALNGANGVWKSIEDTYDASGNGFIAPAHEWVEISNATTELTEGAFIPGTKGTLPPFRTITLGNVWDSDKVANPDVNFEVVQADGDFAIVAVDYMLDGDYTGDDVVDAADYGIWKLFFGSTTVLTADGNLNGVVDAADYTIWRDNVGRSLLGTTFSSAMTPGLAAGAAVGVPEPETMTLIVGALIILATRVPRRLA